MKKILLLLAVSAFSLCLYAQDSRTDTTRHHMGRTDMSKSKDCVFMQNGSMMVMKNGETTPMAQDMTMTDGSVVMTNGTVKMKDGKTKQLKNDECVYMDGHTGHIKHHMTKKGKMK